MKEELVKTQIALPKKVDKMLKLIKVEFDLENKSEAVEFAVKQTYEKKFKPHIEAKFKKVLTKSHRKLSAKRAKTVKEWESEMEKW